MWEVVEFMFDVGVFLIVFIYNIYICVFWEFRRIDDVRRVLFGMVVFDVVFYNILMYGYVKLRKIREVFFLFGELIVRNICFSVVIYNILMDGFCELGDLEIV